MRKMVPHMRALSLLANMEAIEAEGHPLETLSELRARGLAKRFGPILVGSEIQYFTCITEAGRAALAATSEGSTDGQ